MAKKLRPLFILLSLIIVVSVVLFSGCTPQERVTPDRDRTGTPQGTRMGDRDVDPDLDPNMDRNMGRDMDIEGIDDDRNIDETKNMDGLNGRFGILGNNRNNENAPMSDDRQRSQTLERQLDRMREVDDANVLVNGGTVIVGYKPTYSSQDIETVKSKIVKMVKKLDENVDNVAVTEADDIIARIRMLSDDMSANKPKTELNNEIRQILQRINPATG